LRGDPRQVLDLASQLMSRQPLENAGVQRAEESRTLALIATGAAKLHLGALAEAGPLLHDGLALARQTGLAEAQVCAGSHLALWQADEGHLRAATHTARETLDLADRLGLTLMRDLGWVRLAQAEAHYQWDRLDEAGKLAEEALDDAYGVSEMVVSAAVMLARIGIAAGRLMEAHRVLDTVRDDAMRAQVTPRTRRSVSLVEAELRLAGGDIPAARRRLSDWSGEEPLPAWSAVVDASLLLAEGKAAAAAAAVAPYLAETSSLTRAVEAGVLTALAGQALRDRARATRGLDIALKAAEEEGFRRSFSGAHYDVRNLIDAVAPTMTVYRPVASELVQERDALSPEGLAAATLSRYAIRRAEGINEPLTERELTVLRYLQTRLSVMEIGSSLHISINTVKTHTRNIYRKLNAGGRREAVRRGRDLRLL
jgi:LuxR family maltose regulon positive regulatory protein